MARQMVVAKGMTVARLNRTIRRPVAALALLALLAACEREVILSGQRFELRAPLDASSTAAPGVDVRLDRPENRVLPISLPAPVTNADWSHRGGSVTNLMPHVALSAAPQPLWSASIGAGNSRRQAITAAPVVAGGQVFTLDAQSRVAAFSTSGAALWAFDATPPGESNASASGGGLAVAGGRVYATTGFGELLALDAASGALVWRHRFDAPVTGAPTVAGDTVYVSGRDSTGWAIYAADGRERWVISGVPSSSGFAGGAAPAVTDRLAIFPFASGEVAAATRDRGNRSWTAPVAGQRAGRAIALVSDITGDPVVAGAVTYAGSASGRLRALRTDTGERVWDAAEGALGPVWPAGGSIFLVSDESRLVRLDAATGQVIWSVEMPHFLRDSPRRRQAVVAHYGPVLAGGRLVVASSDGEVRFFAPESGALTGALALPGGAAAAPAVAGGVLYVVSQSGQIHAFR